MPIICKPGFKLYNGLLCGCIDPNSSPNNDRDKCICHFGFKEDYDGTCIKSFGGILKFSFFATVLVICFILL